MTRSLLLIALLGLGACADPAEAPADDATEAGVAEPSDVAFGETVPDGAALSPDELIANPDAYAGKTVVVEGVAREVCQMAGCWLTFSNDAGQTVRVNVPRDETESYVFTFPKDVSGQTVRVAGTLEVETTSVEDQRHYAEDGGASEDEVAAITEPKQTLVLTALGAELAEAADRAPGTAPA
ncbi:DUF4920 domain-containing protein [Rubrivirga marina]|uniref:DUF4920 domain-containing protein n=1 Tax=Rubrivirga marina TaxID=1196024 RepID=A0A271IWH3_9BACT|nr:DUF4920 domain-containing protein [Rubrivirga marina]PAP75164.1 hypothetical protein BSZ37_01250 [Rubrivirga marina]